MLVLAEMRRARVRPAPEALAALADACTEGIRAPAADALVAGAAAGVDGPDDAVLLPELVRLLRAMRQVAGPPPRLALRASPLAPSCVHARYRARA